MLCTETLFQNVIFHINGESSKKHLATEDGFEGPPLVLLIMLEKLMY